MGFEDNNRQTSFFPVIYTKKKVFVKKHLLFLYILLSIYALGSASHFT